MIRKSCVSFLLLLSLCHYAQEKPETDKPKQNGFSNASFRIYTDFQGYGGNQPNGLIQSQLRWWWSFLNPAITLKSKNEGSPTMKLFLFKNIIFPVVNISTLDDKFKGKQINYDNSDTNNLIHHIHTLDLIKYSSFNVSGTMNLFAINFESSKRKINFYADLFGTLYNTELRDTLLSAETLRANSLGYGYNLALEFFPKGSNWSLRASMQGFGLTLYNNNIRQNYGSIYEPASSSSNDKFYDKDSAGVSTWNYIFSAEVGYSGTPNGDGFTNPDLFFRISYYNNVFDSSASPKVNAANNFLQVQLGINKSIEELIEFLKPKNTDKENDGAK